jgi:hypothetical protein
LIIEMKIEIVNPEPELVLDIAEALPPSHTFHPKITAKQVGAILNSLIKQDYGRAQMFADIAMNCEDEV